MYPPTTDSSNQEPTPLNFVGQKKNHVEKKEKKQAGAELRQGQSSQS